MAEYEGSPEEGGMTQPGNSEWPSASSTGLPSRSKTGLNRFGRRQWDEEREKYVWLKTDLEFSKHFMHTRNGWAFDTDMRERLLSDYRCKSLRIETTDGAVYEADMEDFLLNVSEPFQVRGYREQVVLPLSFWRVTHPEKTVA